MVHRKIAELCYHLLPLFHLSMPIEHSVTVRRNNLQRYIQKSNLKPQVLKLDPRLILRWCECFQGDIVRDQAQLLPEDVASVEADRYSVEEPSQAIHPDILT